MNKGNIYCSASRAFLRYGDAGLYKIRDVFSFLRVLSHTSDILPLLCVRDTLRVLDATGESECIEALEFVYFDNIKLPIKKNEITYRVKRFATERYIDERTVYRRLERAGKIWRSLMDKRMGERAA